MSEKKRVLEGRRAATSTSRAWFIGGILNALAIVHSASAQNPGSWVGPGANPRASGSAAQAATESDQTDARYQVLVDEALTEYERGDWDEAAALFGRAHALHPSARTLRGLGLSAFEARRYADAMRFLSAALSDTRRALTAKQREEVSATLERAKLFAGYLSLRIEPSAATVTLNGQAVHPDPDGSVTIDPGWLDVEVKANGYDTLMRHIRVNAGEHQVLDARLSPQPRAAPTEVGPAPKIDPAAVSSSASPRSTLHSSPLSTWKWISSAAALAALGTGAALLTTQKLRAHEYGADCIQTLTPALDCVTRRSSLGSGSILWTGSIVGLSAGAGLAALSVVLFALDAHPGERERNEQVGLRACTTGPTSIACRWQF